MKKNWLLVLLVMGILSGCSGEEITGKNGQIGDGQAGTEDTSEALDLRQDGEALQVENQVLPEELEQELLKGLVFIETEELCGSGYIWEYEEDMVIVTAAHVLEDASAGIQVTLADGYRTSVDLYWICQNSDLAFLLIDGKRIPQLRMEKYHQVKKSADSFNRLQPEDSLYAMGHTGGSSVLIQQGSLIDKWIYVEAFEQFMVVAQMEIRLGMSGGGLFDEQGACLGILCGTDEAGQTVAVPYQVIEAEQVSIYWR